MGLGAGIVALRLMGDQCRMAGLVSDRGAARQEWKDGWPLVLASAAGMSIAPITTYTMGMFVAPLEAEFGWSRAFIATGLTVNAVIGVIFAAFVGALIDKFGPRRIAIPGLVIFCLSLSLLSTATSSAIYWWTLWLGMAIGSLMLKPTVWTWAVVSRFREARGLALALALSGTAVTAIVSPFFADYFIRNFGWRWAYAGLAATYAVVMIPLVVMFFYGANDLRRTSGEAATEKPAERPAGLSVKQAFASFTYWKITIGTFLVILTITGGVVHLVPMLQHGGLERSAAVAAAGVMGVAAFCGRLLAGVLLDRVNAKIVGGIAFLMPAAVALALLGFDGGTAMAIGIAVILGLCTGAEIEVASYLSSKHFGLRNFGALFGVIAGLMSLASGTSPALAGLVFDIYGSYDLALFVAIGLSMAASTLIFALPAYPREFATSTD